MKVFSSTRGHHFSGAFCWELPGPNRRWWVALVSYYGEAGRDLGSTAGGENGYPSEI